MKKNLRLALGVLALCSPVAWASGGVAQPTHYVTEGGWGRLTVQAATPQGQAFALSAQGANGHSCTLEGVMQQGKATLRAFDPACVVSFAPAAQGALDVQTPTPEPCRDYCGARAGFTGLYLPLPAACAPDAWSQSGRAFMNAYRARDYAKAVALQQNRLQSCAASLFWLEAHQARNDLAIAQFHAGQKLACRKTLAPIRAVRVSDLPPADAEGFAPIAKAAAFNWRQCGGR